MYIFSHFPHCQEILLIGSSATKILHLLVSYERMGIDDNFVRSWTNKQEWHLFSKTPQIKNICLLSFWGTCPFGYIFKKQQQKRGIYRPTRCLAPGAFRRNWSRRWIFFSGKKNKRFSTIFPIVNAWCYFISDFKGKVELQTHSSLQPPKSRINTRHPYSRSHGLKLWTSFAKRQLLKTTNMHNTESSGFQLLSQKGLIPHKVKPGSPTTCMVNDLYLCTTASEQDVEKRMKRRWEKGEGRGRARTLLYWSQCHCK